MREIGAQIGMSQRAMRAWLKAGLIPRVPFRGTATRYPPEALTQARRVRELRDQRLDFEQIRRRLAAEQAAAEKARIEAEAAKAAATSAPPQVIETTPIAPATTAGPGDTWQRIVLLPGLELHVRSDGGALLQRLAAEIRTNYGVAAPHAGGGPL